MQWKNWFRRLKPKGLSVRGWFLRVFRFQKGNLLDQLFRISVVLIFLVIVSAWVGGTFLFPVKSDPPQPVVSIPDNFRELVSKELDALLAAKYPWVLEELEVEQVSVGPKDIQDLQPVSPLVDPKPEPTSPKPGTVPEDTLDRLEEEVLSISFDRLLWPVKAEVTTSYGWYRHPVYKDWRFNGGVALQTATNDGIRSVLPGRVETVKPGGQGYEIVIEHGSGWHTVYRDIQNVSVVPGENVNQNQIIADAGTHGNLFFALHYDRLPVDPFQYLR